MFNRVLSGASVAVIGVVILYFATTTFSQSGRRPVAAQRQDETPSLTTDDVAPAPVATAPVGHAPNPGDVVGAAGPIAWRTSFVNARDEAKDDQVVFVDVYTDWCGWCKYMDERVYTDPAVQQFASNNVFVRLNAEDGAEGTAFAREVGVRGYPTLLVYKGGRLVGQQPGAFRKASDFVAWLRATSTQH
jgi:thiol-disulfide isomerase/thioredoxin